MGGKSSKNKKSKEEAPTALLVDGAIVFLTSKASGKLLRVHEGNIDAQGEEGECAQFTVSKKESESGHVVTLQHGEKYVSVTEEKVELCDESSELKAVEAEGGCVSFESVKAAGHYLSVQEDGSIQSGSELGPSTHFTVASAVKKEEEAPPADNTAATKGEEQQQQETNAAEENEQQKTEETEQKENEEPQQQEGQEEQAASES